MSSPMTSATVPSVDMVKCPRENELISSSSEYIASLPSNLSQKSRHNHSKARSVASLKTGKLGISPCVASCRMSTNIDGNFISAAFVYIETLYLDV